MPLQSCLIDYKSFGIQCSSPVAHAPTLTSSWRHSAVLRSWSPAAVTPATSLHWSEVFSSATVLLALDKAALKLQQKGPD
jgi:hypothetical protein